MRSLLSLVLLAGCTVEEVSTDVVTEELGTEVIDVCGSGVNRCGAQVIATGGEIQAFANSQGFGADALAAAYNIPATGEGTPTIAIVVAFGYGKLEDDLAVYRKRYELPACTKANGCLRIVSSSGGTDLPADAPADRDWTLETMLDVEMASAACPRCKLLVVQGADDGNSLLEAQATAVALGADVISNSWGTAEKTGVSLANLETYFDQPIAIFAAAGDRGWNDDGAGPHYPATSAHVFAVGGTKLERDGEGYRESVWAKGGSACSLSIAKPAYQTTSSCAFRASADVAAVGDPRTGVAIYHSRGGSGWKVAGGTSAATPLVAGIFASAGHGKRTTAQLPLLASALRDVTIGKNGTCGTELCEGRTGWDGPSGFGTPDAMALAAIEIAEPPAGSGSGSDDDDEPFVGGGAAPAGCSATAGSASWVGLVLVGLALVRRRRAK